jgi:hypothetical protein
LAVEVKISKYGFIYLDIDIKPRNTSIMKVTTYKVDTGANCTTISCMQLAQLGFDDDWIKTSKALKGDARPTLASNHPLDDCYQIILPEIHIGEWVGYNWPFTTSLSIPFKFLLGTDTMQFFNWTLDYKKRICTFDLIADKRQLHFNKKVQSIHAID